MEFVVPEHRNRAGVYINVAYSCGGLCLAVAAYFLKHNWRLLMLVTASPALLYLGNFW